MKLGYARVSTEDQSLDLQRPRLRGAGCERLFEEKVSGAKRNRPELEKLLSEIRAKDVLIVTRLDRLARSTAELLAIAERIAEKDAGLQSLDEPWGKRGKSGGGGGGGFGYGVWCGKLTRIARSGFPNRVISDSMRGCRRRRKSMRLVCLS
jgi:hypothetical protein